jgi:predicted transcriptional regulator
MAETTTITVRVPVAVKERLDRLAELTRRSRSFLSAEALEIYTRNELEIVEQIAEGLEDVKAGRTVPHEEVVAETRAIIEAAYARQTAKKAVNE